MDGSNTWGDFTVAPDGAGGHLAAEPASYERLDGTASRAMLRAVSAKGDRNRSPNRPRPPFGAAAPNEEIGGASLCGAARNKRVLVVDDETIVLDALERMLTSLGFGVITAQDGEEALAVLDGNHVDMILCDLRMPRLGGPELYAAVSACAPWLARRMIFCTGDTESDDGRDFLRRTCCRVITKPFNMNQLAQAMAEVQSGTGPKSPTWQSHSGDGDGTGKGQVDGQ